MYHCTSRSIQLKNFPAREHSPKNFVGNPTNTGKIRRYSAKVLFSGVFQDSSIFQDGARIWMKMVEMEENSI